MVFELLGAFSRFEKTVDIAGRLADRGPLTIAHGLLATLEPPVDSSNAARQVRSNRFEPPTFKFDQNGDKTHRSADHGLDEYGPFDSARPHCCHRPRPAARQLDRCPARNGRPRRVLPRPRNRWTRRRRLQTR